jgi:hypothetical protein
MGMGCLSIAALAAEEALPIEGVRIIIRDENRNILAEYSTDDSGQTETICLEAPDKENSLDPNATGPRYRTVEVEIIKPGFTTIGVDHVQIYDGVDSYLPIHMYPATDGRPALETYDIPKPAVEDSSPRFMPEPQHGTLSEVIVPDTITVHLGRPNNHARDLRVPFQEYVRVIINAN